MEPNNYCFSPNCQKSHDDQVLSPPLTPALSPYKRDLNYRRASTNDYHHPYWPSQQQQEPQRPMSFSDQSASTRKRPIKQNKHACTYPRCFWSFKRFEHLKRHMLVHTGERPHGCPFPGCGKRFSRTDNFHAHYRTHTKKTLQKNDENFSHVPSPPSMNSTNPAIETQRQPSLAFTSSRRTILTNDHPPPPPLQQQTPIHHQYSYSHSTYHRDQQQLHHLNHQQPHPPPPPQNLHHQQRASSHDSDKQHVCTHHQCQRRFKRLEHLKRHMRIHTMERPFHCNFPGCQKAFSRSDNLTQHSKTHLRSNESRGSRNNSTSSSSSSASPLSSTSSSSAPSSSPSSFYAHHPPPPAVLHPDSLGFNDYIRPAATAPSLPYNKHRQDPPPSLHPILHWQQHTSDATSGNINC